MQQTANFAIHFFIYNENNEYKGLTFYVNRLMAKSPVGHVFLKIPLCSDYFCQNSPDDNKD